MKKRKDKLDSDLALLEEMGVTQYNRTDPDAKLMVKPAHNLMAYNTQIAVDEKYKFIVATDVSSQANDFGKLSTMADRVNEITQEEAHITIVADAGYYSAKDMHRCHTNGIDVYVPLPHKQSKAKQEGYFVQTDFVYNQEKDVFICPNQKELTKSPSFNTKNDGTKYYFYRAGSKTCNSCPLRQQCIPDQTAYKKVAASEYYHTIQAHQQKMQTPKAKKIMQQRAALVEHPFGTIKRTLGWDHYLVRGKKKVSGENALIMFTYNFKRLLGLIGITLFQKLIKAIQNNNTEAIKQEIAEHIAHFRLNLADFMGLFGFIGTLEKKWV